MSVLDARMVSERIVPCVDRAIERLLEFDPDTGAALARLEGRVVAVEVKGLDRAIYVVPGAHGVSVRLEHAGDVHVRIRGSPTDFLTLGRSRLQQQPIPAGTIEIIGDLSTVQQVQSILGQLSIDWEELVSRVVGDTAARKLGNLVRDLRGWLRSTRESMEMNISEYARYETEVLPDRDQVDRFNRDIDTLRADSDRLAERVRRLHRNLLIGS